MKEDTQESVTFSMDLEDANLGSFVCTATKVKMKIMKKKDILKILMIWRQNFEKARDEFIEYYIRDVASASDINYIESESGKIYDGPDWCYNKGDNFEYIFEFYVDKKIAKDKIESQIFVDAVKKFAFL